MKTILCATVALFLTGCSHVVRLAVTVPPKPLVSPTERGCLTALDRATKTNAGYPKALKDRKLTTYRAKMTVDPSLTDVKAQGACIAALEKVGPLNAAYRRKLEETAKK